ncbi:hypothetical protein FS837_000860, partial [Tulasnella sp. UAMH 9824]
MYYMVDHRNRQVFWKSDIEFDSIGISPWPSRADLEGSLTPEYWLHVDYFPTHMSFDENLSGAERELIAILGHGVV